MNSHMIQGYVVKGKENFVGIEVPFATKAAWGRRELAALRGLPVSAPLTVGGASLPMLSPRPDPHTPHSV